MSDSDYIDGRTLPPGTPNATGVLAAVDQFEILKPLGAGGFGTVYLARDTTSDIQVALKVIGGDRETACCRAEIGSLTLKPDSASGVKSPENELRENFKLIHGLTHPNIAVAYPLHLVREVRKLGGDVSVKSGDILSVMAYAPGITLDRWRKMFAGGRVPVALALEIVGEIAAALDYAHDNGVVHRDIKPSNIMVETKSGTRPFVRLLDFGLATTTGSMREEVSGTPAYMAPEQWTGGTQDARTDQYAIAVLTCELLTGRIPYAAAFLSKDCEVMRMAVTGRDTVDLPDGLSARQRAVLVRALAKDMAERYPSCAAFVSAMRSASRVNLLVPGVIGAVFVAIALTGWWMMSPSSKTIEDERPASPITKAALIESPSTPASEPPASVRQTAFAERSTPVSEQPKPVLVQPKPVSEQPESVSKQPEPESVRSRSRPVSHKPQSHPLPTNAQKVRQTEAFTSREMSMMRNLKIFEDTMSARIGDYREIGDEAVVKIASEMQEDYLRKKQAALACKESDKNSYVLKMRTALKVLNDFDEFHKQLKEKKP